MLRESIELRHPLESAPRRATVWIGGRMRDVDKHELADLLRELNPRVEVTVARTMDRVWCGDVVFTLGPRRAFFIYEWQWHESPHPWAAP